MLNVASIALHKSHKTFGKHVTPYMCRILSSSDIHCISTKLGGKVYILLFNGFLRFHATNLHALLKCQQKSQGGGLFMMFTLWSVHHLCSWTSASESYFVPVSFTLISKLREAIALRCLLREVASSCMCVQCVATELLHRATVHQLFSVNSDVDIHVLCDLQTVCSLLYTSAPHHITTPAATVLPR